MSEMKTEKDVEKIVSISKSPKKISSLPKQLSNIKPSTQESVNEAASLRSKDKDSSRKKPGPLIPSLVERRSTDPSDSLPRSNTGAPMRMPQVLLPNPVNNFSETKGLPVSLDNSPSTFKLHAMT